MDNRTRLFQELSGQAAACRLCPRLADQPAVLGPGNGSLEGRVLFLAEAPGRLGAGRTGIPFSGDRSGQNFEILLRHAGLRRNQVFITNAILCTPLENGKNSRPAAAEIRNCSGFLRATLDIVRPSLVVTLGATGLAAVNRLLGTRHRLAETVARPLEAPHFKLLPLYHPSPRVIHTRRSMARQKRDFGKIRAILEGPLVPESGQTPVGA